MSRRLSFVAFGALAVIGIGAVILVGRIDPTRGRLGRAAQDPEDLAVLADSVPDVTTAAAGWLNVPELRPTDLDGRVVVYDFWTYSCVNCLRTLPYLRAWHERYQADGLVIVGVHSPEFDFEKGRENVSRAVDDLDVTWPVALDDDMVIWTLFQNAYWPAKYVVDRDGRLRYVHFGEGAYDETEDVLRSLLGVDRSAPRAAEVDGSGEPRAATGQTPETYLGSLRGRTASPEGLDLGEREFTAPRDMPDDSFALSGRWEVAEEYVGAREARAEIVLRYRASEVNLVLEAVGGAPIEVDVELDGEPLDPAAVAADVTTQPDETTAVSVNEPRLYALVADGPSGYHELRLTALASGVRAYAFTFGTR
ncbi:MAG: redoxin domain-containing protein [Acidimicrobiales bacterium]